MADNPKSNLLESVFNDMHNILVDNDRLIAGEKRNREILAQLPSSLPPQPLHSTVTPTPATKTTTMRFNSDPQSAVSPLQSSLAASHTDDYVMRTGSESVAQKQTHTHTRTDNSAITAQQQLSLLKSQIDQQNRQIQRLKQDGFGVSAGSPAVAARHNQPITAGAATAAGGGQPGSANSALLNDELALSQKIDMMNKITLQQLNIELLQKDKLLLENEKNALQERMQKMESKYSQLIKEVDLFKKLAPSVGGTAAAEMGGGTLGDEDETRATSSSHDSLIGTKFGAPSISNSQASPFPHAHHHAHHQAPPHSTHSAHLTHQQYNPYEFNANFAAAPMNQSYHSNYVEENAAPPHPFQASHPFQQFYQQYQQAAPPPPAAQPTQSISIHQNNALLHQQASQQHPELPPLFTATSKSSSWNELRFHRIKPATSANMTPEMSKRNTRIGQKNTAAQSNAASAGDFLKRNFSFGKDHSSQIEKPMGNLRISVKQKKRSSMFPLGKSSVASSMITGNRSTDDLLEPAGHPSNYHHPPPPPLSAHFGGGANNFQRFNQLRATTGPRLNAFGSPENSQLHPHYQQHYRHSAAAYNHQIRLDANQACIVPDKSTLLKQDFSTWSVEQVCGLLEFLGLASLVPACRKAQRTGFQLLHTTRKEFVKLLDCRDHPMIAKKLLVNIQSLTASPFLASAAIHPTRRNLKISENFSLRIWLEDLGLLQYVRTFSSHGVDALMLDQLSVQDLHWLEITNELHRVSLKRGLQLLRSVQYDLNAMIRRPPNTLMMLKKKKNANLCVKKSNNNGGQKNEEDNEEGEDEDAEDEEAEDDDEEDGEASPGASIENKSFHGNPQTATSDAPRAPEEQDDDDDDDAANDANDNKLKEKQQHEQDLEEKERRNGSSCGDGGGGGTASPGEVCRWSHHQVMSWLSDINLPEFASNIRGSGVHGALIILEDRFNSETLAAILNIPASKSLLRRHLHEQFAALLGPELAAVKEAARAHPDFAPINLISKPPPKASAIRRLLTRKNLMRRKDAASSSQHVEQLVCAYELNTNHLDLKLKNTQN